MDTVCFFGANWPHLYISTLKHSLPTTFLSPGVTIPTLIAVRPYTYIHLMAIPWFRSSLPWCREPLAGVATVEAQADLHTGKALCQFLCVSKMHSDLAQRHVRVYIIPNVSHVSNYFINRITPLCAFILEATDNCSAQLWLPFPHCKPE